jgi:hypothetical protein
MLWGNINENTLVVHNSTGVTAFYNEMRIIKFKEDK